MSHTLLSSPEVGIRKLKFHASRFKLAIQKQLHNPLVQLIDPLVAAIIVISLLPLIILRAVLAMYSCGYLFDRQPVTGKQGKTFHLLTFSGKQPGAKIACLLNILRGDMAFVGPQLNEHTDAIRTSVKPGLISTYRIRKNVCIAHEDESTADTEYVYRKTLTGDIAIVARHLISKILRGSKDLPIPYTIDFFGIKLWNTSMKEAVKWILMSTQNRDKIQLAFVNPDCLNISFKNAEYRDLLKRIDHVLPDGIGIKIGSRMQNVSLRENVNGTDMFPILCEEMSHTDLKLFMLGSKPGIAQKAADNMRKKYPGLKICGSHDGYFTECEEQNVIDYINERKPDILLVAMGAPHQDLWIAKNLDKLDTHIAIGVGGLFDYYSGVTERAPRWVREIGMEWAWRILQEPGRMWKRYIIGNPLFLYRVWRYGDKAQNKDTLINHDAHIDIPENSAYLLKRIRKTLWLINQSVQTCYKRLFDITASSFLITVLSPLMLLTAIAIKIESDGPVFFKQIRIGKNGCRFDFWKFRSMYVDAEARKESLIINNEMQGGVLFKMRTDPRITRIGRIIRKTSIDELPQLWNVLKGDMSLVGPRPCLPDEADNYSSADRYRLDSMPGITCIWQISGRSDIPFEQQVKMDLSYINRSSFWSDLGILFKTIPAVITGRGAY